MATPPGGADARARRGSYNASGSCAPPADAGEGGPAEEGQEGANGEEALEEEGRGEAGKVAARGGRDEERKGRGGGRECERRQRLGLHHDISCLLYGCVRNDENALGGALQLRVVARTSETIHCYSHTGSIRRPRSSGREIRRSRSHQGIETDGRMLLNSKRARGPTRILFLDVCTSISKNRRL